MHDNQPLKIAHVIELYDENATRKNILGTFRYLSRKVKPEDSLLIFSAGHGHVDNMAPLLC